MNLLVSDISVKRFRTKWLPLAVALLFICASVWFVILHNGSAGSYNSLVILAAIVSAYMAINIGANDVANNVGPAVGAKALTLPVAILLAVCFETLGASLAGGKVVATINTGIIDTATMVDSDTFVLMMLSAVLAGAIWLNIATALAAPVSTTHSLVGGMLGAGVAAGGAAIVNTNTLLTIVLSWIVSPLLAGLIAALLLYLIKHFITYRSDMLRAATRILPVSIALISWAFLSYLLHNGFDHHWGFEHFWVFDLIGVSGLSLIVALLIFLLLNIQIRHSAQQLTNNKDSLNSLFTLPLIVSAAILSFAHGANDVANAVGPLIAINEVFVSASIAQEVIMPMWVMLIGAIGIALGLALFGPKIIRMVGSEITELNQVRAFCIASASAITVLLASQQGLPVSSTHIAVGGIFGVGFLREYLKSNYNEMIQTIKHHHPSDDQQEIAKLLQDFEMAGLAEKHQILATLKSQSAQVGLTKKQCKQLKNVYKTELIKRSHMYRIIAAWILTIPISGIMAALLFFVFTGIMLL